LNKLIASRSFSLRQPEVSDSYNTSTPFTPKIFRGL
jgi:hypothetical protein